jgi:hypothetical protein
VTWEEIAWWVGMLLPVGVLAEWVWSRVRPSRSTVLDVLADTLLFASFSVFMLAIWPWALVGPTARVGVLFALALIIVRGAVELWAARRHGRPASVRPRSMPRSIKTAAYFAAAGAMLVTIGYAFVVEAIDRRTGDPVWIRFPLEGEWSASQAGRTLLFSVHNFVVDQRYALDLVKIGPDGRIWRGRGGKDVTAHYGWEAPVYAPDEAVVLEAENNQPDNPVGVTDPVHLRGNYVLLGRADGTQVLLAHLRRGSVQVRPGDRVVAGQLLGRVGNSGNTSRPHLHLGVMREEGGRLVGVAFGLVDVEPGFVRPWRGQILRKMPRAGAGSAEGEAVR